MIIVTVKSRIKPEYKQKFIDHMTKLLPTVQQERGCRMYQLHQSTSDDNSLLLFEQWDSREDLDAHLQSPHMKQHFAESRSEWFEEVKLEAYTADGFELKI